MLTFLILSALSLLCHDSCVGGPINTVGTPQELGWHAWLLVDTETPRPNNEEGKKRRITPKSVFIAPAFAGTSHLPDCAEGYRPDSMGRCVKLVQLNHAAQLDFLLQRLNAMYAAPVIRHDYVDLSTSHSSSTGPLQLSLPIDTSPEPEEETEESVEVAIVMADVLKRHQLKKNNKTNETEMSQAVVAVLNAGKNETSVEEIETSTDLEVGSGNFHLEDSQLLISNATKYEIINKSENSTIPQANVSLVDDEQLLLTLPTPQSEDSRAEVIKAPDTAMGLLEEVGNVSYEDGRSGNTSRRNASADQKAKKETTTTESAATTTEAVMGNVTDTVHSRNSANSAYVLQSEVTGETKTVVLPTSTIKPSGFVRVGSENIAGRNVTLADEVYDNETRQSVNTSQTDFDHLRPRPMLPSDVHQRQTFWWLPPGWRLDQSRHQPMLIRFWARMPLLRDNHSGMTQNQQEKFTARRRGPLVY
jgi:hypothetical protein